MSKQLRPPIVAVMGHIDHGKSSLLDAIRNTDTISGEAGGITQHISAYEVEHEVNGENKTITFLDTPGHSAFGGTREKGAMAADIAVLVVAADEGVKPQTLEALETIKKAGVPFVVAITKIDKDNADVTRAQSSLLENEIYIEGMGGDVPYAKISSKTGEGIPELLELITLTGELAELEADTETVDGIVLESSCDNKQGNSATLIIKNGTLKLKDFVVAGDAITPIRFIEDYKGDRIKEASPSKPVRIVGWDKVPTPGESFAVFANKKDAEKAAAENSKDSAVASEENTDVSGATLPIILKVDVLGSIDAIKTELGKISEDDISVKIIKEGIGNVSEDDVKKSIASGGALIIGFGVKTDKNARDLADRSDVNIHLFDIIYELTELVENKLKENKPKKEVTEDTGRARVLKVFSITGTKVVLGGEVKEGTLQVSSKIRIERRGIKVGTGKVLNLQKQKNDVDSINKDEQFGGQVDTKHQIVEGDDIIQFETKII